MQLNELKHDAERLCAPLARDAEGRLYDPRVREMVRAMRALRPNLRQDMVEAMSALRLASRSIKASMEGWAEAQGLSEGRMQLLMRLRWAAGRQLPLGELADRLGVTPRNITGLIDNLERDGLVERVPDKEDRRSIHARLTDKGLRKIEELWREAVSGQPQLLQGISREELESLRDVCLRIVDNVGRASSPARTRRDQ
jgi:DNA-binding MarR family transcriptional regulator